MLHELFLITRQKTKIRNTFANNRSTDIKFTKVQTSKIIQSGGTFRVSFISPKIKKNYKVITLKY